MAGQTATGALSARRPKADVGLSPACSMFQVGPKWVLGGSQILARHACQQVVSTFVHSKASGSSPEESALKSNDRVCQSAES